MANRAHVMKFMVVLVLAALAQAQTFTSIFSFDGTDGSSPYTGRLAMNPTTGTLYGTAVWGGSSGYGVVFSLTTAGTEAVLYNFTGGSDGANPSAPVIRDSKGNLYGTTSIGGSSNQGVVFKMDSAGNETVLHSFSGGTSDGCNPSQGLVRDKNGNLYGTTVFCGSSNYGIMFKIDTAGNETILHNFAGSDGDYPSVGSMLIDAKGNLYGVTYLGGSAGCGTLYRYSSSGRFSVLHSFTGGTSDGCLPYGTPAQDGKGNLYGTTESGGAHNYDGTVWKVSSSGAETILHNFKNSDGAFPYGGVALDKKGNLYGLAWQGGAYGYGALYRLSAKRKLTLLHSFDGSDGSKPQGDEVLIDIKGTLYGATNAGGAYSDGTVWKYVP